MGTNYYLMSNPCDKCGHIEERIHIGKLSSWGFIFHEIKELSTVSDWIRFLRLKTETFDTHRIIDEYNRGLSVDTFKKLLQKSKYDNKNKWYTKEQMREGFAWVKEEFN